MADRVPYPINTPWGAQVAEYASLVAQAQALGARLLAALNSMVAGGAGPFDDMEGEMNLQEGNGMPLYQHINTSVQSLEQIDVSPIDQGS